jgi:hypothetical protein
MPLVVAPASSALVVTTIKGRKSLALAEMVKGKPQVLAWFVTTAAAHKFAAESGIPLR